MHVIVDIAEDQATILLSRDDEVFDWRIIGFEGSLTPGGAYVEAHQLAQFLEAELVVTGLPVLLAHQGPAEVTVGLLQGRENGIATLADAVTLHQYTGTVLVQPRLACFPEDDLAELSGSDAAALEWAACVDLDVKGRLEATRSTQASLVKRQCVLQMAMVEADLAPKTNRMGMYYPRDPD